MIIRRLTSVRFSPRRTNSLAGETTLRGDAVSASFNSLSPHENALSPTSHPPSSVAVSQELKLDGEILIGKKQKMTLNLLKRHQTSTV